MQKLGLGITAPISQPTTRPSRALSIPQPPVTTLPPPPVRTFISALTANTIQVTTTSHPQYAGTYIVGQDPGAGVPYYFLSPETDFYFWFPTGAGQQDWVLDSIIVNQYAALSPAGPNLGGRSYELPTDQWTAIQGSQPINFNFTVIN